MASKSYKTKMKRRRVLQNQGKKRKAAVRAKGTTRSKKELFGE